MEQNVLLGGALIAGSLVVLVAADAVARIAFAPLQFPVGLVTGSLGGVFFLVLMKRRTR